MNSVNETLADDIAWLTENTLTWRLVCDPHKAVQDDQRGYLRFQRVEPEPEWLTSEHLFHVTAYPSNLGEGVETFGVTAAAAVHRLRTALEGEGKL